MGEEMSRSEEDWTMDGRGAGWGGAGGTGEGCSDALEADGAADYDGFESAHK